VQIVGVNDAPAVAGAVTGGAQEDGAIVTLNALAHASDVDAGAVLSVTNVPSSLPAGVTYNASTHSFSLDPSHGAFQHLAAGDYTVVTVSYGVTDGSATAPASVSWTVTGTNDKPVAEVKTDAATEGGSTIHGHVMATDADDGASLTYSLTDAGPLPAGLTFNADGSYSFDPTGGAYDHLAQGAKQEVVVHFKANDGTADSNVQTLSITVTGTNDAPTITSGANGTVAENAPTSTVIYTATTIDPDSVDTVTYSLTGDDALMLSIDAAGEVTLNASADAEVKANYSFNVVATDGGGLSDVKAVDHLDQRRQRVRRDDAERQQRGGQRRR
jgi:VCBS repeat-containing protein